MRRRRVCIEWNRRGCLIGIRKRMGMRMLIWVGIGIGIIVWWVLLLM